jgi:cytochrome c-type biogenesis protein CcmH/NrfF
LSGDTGRPSRTVRLHAPRRALAAMLACATLLAAALGLAAVTAPPARAAEAAPVADDPVLESRVQTLSEQLRCLVCQNQTLADSHAPLAQDLKSVVRDQLRAGRDEAQVIDYMTQRYGDFVLYRPPLRAATLLLWAGPALLVLAGLAVAWRHLARAGRGAIDAPPPASGPADAEDPDDGDGRPDWLDDASLSEPRRTRR